MKTSRHPSSRKVFGLRSVCMAALTVAMLCGAGFAPAPAARAAGHRCHSPMLYEPRSGGYALIIDDLRVRRVSCRLAVKVGGAYTARDPMPAGWRCGVSSVDYRTYCAFMGSRRRFNFNFEGDAG